MDGSFMSFQKASIPLETRTSYLSPNHFLASAFNPIEFSKLSSTNDVAADSQNSDDSGKVYDFKDSKTSGVVTVTKNWDDSSSNDKRPVPDVSISTVEPSKLNRTYTITFHGNGRNVF